MRDAVGRRCSKLKMSTPSLGEDDLGEIVRVTQTETTCTVVTRKQMHTEGDEKPLPFILFSFGNNDASLSEHFSGEVFQ